MVRGETNLPDGTAFFCEIKEPDDFGLVYQLESKVLGGRFTVGPYWPEEGIQEGDWKVEILVPIPSSQSPQVQAVVGANGERLTGKLVHHGEIGVTVESSTPFRVGEGTAAQAKGRARRSEVRAFELSTLSTLRAIVQRSRGADRESPTCLRRMRSEWAIIAPLAERLARMPLPVPGNGSLRSACSFTKGCADCSSSESSREQCDDATKDLTEAAADIAKEKIR